MAPFDAQVMVAFRNAERNHDCLSCWRELVLLNGLGDVVINDKTYNLALRVAVKIQQWDEMEVILDMMQVPDAILLCACVHTRVCVRHAYT